MFINVLTIYYHRKDKKMFNLREKTAGIETTPQKISPLSPLTHATVFKFRLPFENKKKGVIVES